MNTPIAAGILALVYITYIFQGVFDHFLDAGSWSTLKYSLSLPSTWIVSVIGIVVGLGLIKKKRWAWFLAIIAVLVQISRVTPHYLKLLPFEGVPESVFLSMTVVQIMLWCFLFLVALPTTRRQCFASRGTQ